MSDLDIEFRSLLARRIRAYRDEEARLEARLAELRHEQESLIARRKSAEGLYAAEFGHPPTHDELALIDEARPPSPQPGPYTGLTWREAMVRILADAGEPLHVKAIWGELEAGGFHTDSRDPIRSAVAILVQTPDFEGHGRNHYGLKRPSLQVVGGETKGGEA